MKTLITTFAIAVMVFAFNPISVMAGEKSNKKVEEDMGKFGTGLIESGKWIECNLGGEGRPVAECNEKFKDAFSENESGETDSERDIADSGNEDSTSAASASDQ